MARFQPGQSGNPKGRPTKDRALTDSLERAGSATLEFNGSNVSGKRLIGLLAWQGLTTGEITFPDGKVMHLSPQDWKDLLKWIYGQVDGPPKQNVDITTGGETLKPTQFDYETFIRNFTPRSDSDSDAPGKDESHLHGSALG